MKTRTVHNNDIIHVNAFPRFQDRVELLYIVSNQHHHVCHLFFPPLKQPPVAAHPQAHQPFLRNADHFTTLLMIHNSAP
jgi:hypothetical protein